jgi:spore coat protein U-like protein
MNWRSIYLATAMGLVASPASLAATATGSFDVQITIQESCVTTSASGSTVLNFGTQTLLNANVDAAVNLSVQCTSGTDYDVTLDNGLNTSRRMDSTAGAGVGANIVDYELYSDSGRTTVFPTTAGTAPYPYTGTGTAQTITVYGRVAPQTTPPAGNYYDTVGITVTY